MPSLIRAVRETLASPYSYGGALLVGGLSFLARDLRLGFLVPFIVPFVVQAFARYLSMRERARNPGERTHTRKEISKDA